ncbi:MAG: tryptophan-rich sensory protein [Clostridiales bacterium]|nr:tryptophan-rich sensory protein [Clostridiales bacterium]
MWKKIKIYVISVLISLGVGGLSALLTKNNMEIYSSINRPPLSPPSFLFPIVWTILFILMGISAAIIYKSHSPLRRSALRVYIVQLIFNFLWTLIFFNVQAYTFASVWIIALLALIVFMIIKFYKIKPLAAYLQIPYLLWVTFASYLTIAIAVLN